MHIAEIWLYPIKSLDGVAVSAAEIAPGGGLRHDRAWALVDRDGNFLNGKREPRLHRLRAAYAADITSVTFSVPTDENGPHPATLSLAEPKRVAEWLGEFLRQHVELRHDPRDGFPDDTAAPGPTLIAAASLQAIADWFPGLTGAEVRRRLRPNIVVAGAEAWEDDRWYGPPGKQIALQLGAVQLAGSNPCQRCAVPARDSQTGEVHPGFQAEFARQRQRQLPSFAPAERFDHFYRAAVNTCVSAAEPGKSVRVGDPLVVVGHL